MIEQSKLDAFGNQLADQIRQYSMGVGGAERAVGAPTWGTTINVPELLSMFLNEGEYSLGKVGKIVVPASMDFAFGAEVPDGWFATIRFVNGPKFVGNFFTDLISMVGGRPHVEALDIDKPIRKARIRIANFPQDWPIVVER